MNALVFSLLGSFIVLWIIYLLLFRQSRFAFFFWFPFTTVALAGTLFWIWSIGGLLGIKPGQGEAEGFAALGYLAAIVFFIIFPALLIICIRLRPPSEAFKPIFVMSGIGLCALASVSVFYLGAARDNQSLKIIVLDAQLHPIPAVRMHFDMHKHYSGGVFSLPARTGDILTDASGTVTITVPKTHELMCYFKKEGFADSSFTMDITYGRPIHPCGFSWTAPDRYDQGAADFGVTDKKIMEVRLYLPREGTLEKLPYSSVKLWEVKASKGKHKEN